MSDLCKWCNTPVATNTNCCGKCLVSIRTNSHKFTRIPDTHTLPKRFKKLVWFTEHDLIPADAVFTGRTKPYDVTFTNAAGSQSVKPNAGTDYLYEVFEP